MYASFVKDLEQKLLTGNVHIQKTGFYLVKIIRSKLRLEDYIKRCAMLKQLLYYGFSVPCITEQKLSPQTSIFMV